MCSPRYFCFGLLPSLERSCGVLDACIAVGTGITAFLSGFLLPWRRAWILYVPVNRKKGELTRRIVCSFSNGPAAVGELLMQTQLPLPGALSVNRAHLAIRPQRNRYWPSQDTEGPSSRSARRQRRRTISSGGSFFCNPLTMRAICNHTLELSQRVKRNICITIRSAWIYIVLESNLVLVLLRRSVLASQKFISETSRQSVLSYSPAAFVEVPTAVSG